jgi:tetratricopeptide (TPR) repeat protein
MPTSANHKKSLTLSVLCLFLLFPVKATTLPLSDFTQEGTTACLSSVSEWRKYDINGDGQFDKTDIDELIDRGWQDFDYDLNEDGVKDFDDALALFLKLSVMDRSCDNKVTDEDFEPVSPVRLPGEPEYSKVQQIVSNCIFRSFPNLPSDIEAQVFNSIPNANSLTIPERAYAYQLAGLSSLVQNNLDGAQWAFGRAFQTYDQSPSALGNLAFAVAMNGEHDDALMLLAYARKLYPESAATSTSIGWIFARHGQNEEALKYYEEAVFYAPEIGQYHMNLGILLMRMGNKKGAYKEFKEATEKDPEDVKKALFWYTTKPPGEPPKKKPFNPEEFKKEVEKQRREMEEQERTEDEMPEPWDQLSPCEQARMIPEILERRYSEQMENIAQAYADDLARRIEKLIKDYWPQWQNINDDWARYTQGVPVVYKERQSMTLNAEIDAGNRWASLARQMGSELLGYSSFFMESALKQAKYEAEIAVSHLPKGIPITAQSAAELRAKAYNDALEEAIRDCYKAQINQAYSWLADKSRPYSLPNPKVETITAQDFFTLGLVIPLKCFDIKGYCPDGKSGDMGNISLPTDFSIGIDLFFISFEWNMETDEMELNIGQGIILGATWTPETGFGFQIGAGIDGSIGPAGATAVTYLKIDEGVWTVEGKLGGSLGGGPFSVGQDMILFQAVVQEP